MTTPATCARRLCELIGGECSLAVERSRGCRPGLWRKSVAPDGFDELSTLLGTPVTVPGYTAGA